MKCSPSKLQEKLSFAMIFSCVLLPAIARTPDFILVENGIVFSTHDASNSPDPEALADSANFITVPVRLNSSNQRQRFVVKSASYSITTSDTAGIFISTDTSGIEAAEGQPETPTRGVDGVSIDGNGAVIEGPGILSSPHMYGIWFKNRSPNARDTVYGDTVTNITVKRVNRGITLSAIADGLISDCIVDSVYKGIDLTDPLLEGIGVRTVVRRNTVSRWQDRGINVRGSRLRIENNRVVNSLGASSTGGIVVSKSVSHHNVVKYNLVEGGLAGAGIQLSDLTTLNTLEADTVRNFKGSGQKGIQLNNSGRNTVTNCVIEECSVGLALEDGANDNVISGALLSGNVTAVQTMFSQNNLIENSTILGSIIDVEVDNEAALTLHDVVFDANKVAVTGTGSLLRVRYDLDVTVARVTGSPVEGAAVKVYNGATMVYSGTTDTLGHALADLISYDQSPSGKISYSYTVEATKGLSTASRSNVTVSMGSTLQLDLSTTDARDITPPTLPEYDLGQNYPNPFNANTIVWYELAGYGEADLSIYDLLGKKVRTLTSGFQASGRYWVIWDGNDESGNPVASGAYYYQLKTNKSVITKRMMLMK